MFNKKLLPKLIISTSLIFSFQPNLFHFKSLSAHSATNSKNLAVMCGKEKNGKYICFTNEKPPSGQKSKSYKVNSLKEIVDKLNLYGQPIFYEDHSTKQTEIIVWEKPSSLKSLSFQVNLKNPKWWSSLTTYSWWNSSLESSEWSSFYEESIEEYSEDYSEESSESSSHEESHAEESHDDHEESHAEESHDDHDNDNDNDDHEESHAEESHDDHDNDNDNDDHEESQAEESNDDSSDNDDIDD